MTDGFKNFPPETHKFLKKLANNNKREWFLAQAKAYEAAYKTPSKAFAAEMETRLFKLTKKEHTSKIFKINRDLRFSKDKTPYNSHLRVAFAEAKAGPHDPAWMFSLEPKVLCVGVGVMDFGKSSLDLYREAVAGNSGAKLQGILDTLVEGGARFGMEPELKRVPSEFDAEHERAELLRRKSLSVFVDFDSPKDASEPGFVDGCIDRLKDLKPLYDWLNKLS